jgi:hypothetical protein
MHYFKKDIPEWDSFKERWMREVLPDLPFTQENIGLLNFILNNLIEDIPAENNARITFVEKCITLAPETGDTDMFFTLLTKFERYPLDHPEFSKAFETMARTSHKIGMALYEWQWSKLALRESTPGRIKEAISGGSPHRKPLMGADMQYAGRWESETGFKITIRKDGQCNLWQRITSTDVDVTLVWVPDPPKDITDCDLNIIDGQYALIGHRRSGFITWYRMTSPYEDENGIRKMELNEVTLTEKHK